MPKASNANCITFDNECAYIDLGNDRTAIIDESDFDLIKPYRWYAQPYAGRFIVVGRLDGHFHKPRVLLHRLVAGCSVKQVVQFKNNNMLDCRFANLKVLSISQAVALRVQKRPDKSSRYRGVTYCKHFEKYVARISHEGHSYMIGYFEKQKDAALAYDEQALLLHGDKAVLNFPKAAQSQGSEQGR
jgi:hypothetical protein